jgi:hypothetical protein
MKVFWSPLVFVLTGLCAGAIAEPVVVVSAESSAPALSQSQVIDIFLGRYRSFPNGGTAVPIDQPESSVIKADFYRRLVNKEQNDINAYWARLIFSGRTSPPMQANRSLDVPDLLARHPGSVAYMERSQVDKRVRIVMEFSR